MAQTILTRAYETIGITPQFTTYPSARALIQSNDGLTDGEVIRIAGIEHHYPNLIRIDVPLLEARVSVCSKDPSLVVDGWESLRHLRIGTRFGIKLAEMRTRGWSNVFTAHTQEKLFQLLTNDRVDIIIAGEREMLMQISRHKAYSLYLNKTPVEVEKLYHYLHKKHKALVPRITHVLSQMYHDGTLQDFQNDSLQSLRKQLGLAAEH